MSEVNVRVKAQIEALIVNPARMREYLTMGRLTGGDERDRLHEAYDIIEALYASNKWKPIEEHPKDEMFIWAKPLPDGRWSLGLGYNTVSGGWADSLGRRIAGVTHCANLPQRPSPSEE